MNEDAIDRKLVWAFIDGLISDDGERKKGLEYIRSMPPVNPQPCEDAISRQAVLDGLASIAKAKAKSDAQKSLMGRIMFFTEHLPSVTPQEPKTGHWIPMTTRPMTEEEREDYREWFDVDEGMIFDCELPEDGQEVLVSYGGYVCVDTFCKDDGCYFEGVDIDGVEAWMPLPEPYEPQERSDKE